MSDLSFAHPWMLGFLAFVPLLLGLWWWGVVRGRRQLRSFTRQPGTGVGYLTALLVSLAAALAIAAAAQPRWGTKDSALPREGSELVVVLDVSRSMGATDVHPSRLEAAKQAINATLERLGGDRAGLVIFAGDARVRFPLTTDFAAATQVVSSLETGTVLVEGGSSASQGLDVALGAFDPESNAGKLIVLISDGDDLGDDPAGAAQRVRDSGVGLLVVGAGSPEGATVPVFDSQTGSAGPKLDEAGQEIISRLDETFLRAMAVAAGGQYLGADLGAVPGAVQGRLSALERARFAEETAEVPIERFQWFALGALGLLMLGVLLERLPLPSRRSAGTFATAILALVLLSSCATKAHDLNEDGRAAFAAGDYEAAVELFLEAQAEEPDNFDITLNLAAALHASGRHDEAQMAARRTLVSQSAEIRNRAFASLGHHQFALNDLAGSLDSFRSALLEDPADEASRHDYEVVLRLLAPPGEEPAEQPGGSPTPGDGGEGNGTPGPGEGGGSATPGTGGGTPGPGTPGEGEPNGRPDTLMEIDEQLDAIDDEVEALIESTDGEPTAAEALRILDLLAERERIAAIRDAIAGGGDPNDY